MLNLWNKIYPYDSLLFNNNVFGKPNFIETETDIGSRQDFKNSF